MPIIQALGLLLVSYGIGSIPFGLLIVRFLTGKDIRTIESGRTGGTNAMRAAGFWAGLLTAIMDILKATATVWMVRWLMAGANVNLRTWVEVLAPVCAILGHNYSIFLLERNEQGKWRLRGGAGGAPCLGGVLGLWAPSVLIILPMGALLLYFVGYASLATLSVGILATIVFAYRAAVGSASWIYVGYGVVSTVLLAWSLRPNIRRLLSGTERLVGYRARKTK